MANKAASKTPAKSMKSKAPVAVVAPLPDLDGGDDSAGATADQLRIKDLLDRVAVATDLNKNKVRSIVEATLSELGKALEAGEGVNLPQLGKIRIVNSRSEDQGTIMTLKLRRSAAKAGKDSANEALAELGEAS